MNIENAISQMRKGLLEYCILGIIKKNKEAYPSDILSLLQEAQLVVFEGTLYPLLSRLKNAGMLDYRWEESNSGPPRKYYMLTPEGNQFYKLLHKHWTHLSQSVTHINA